MKRSCGAFGLSTSALSGQAPTQARHSVHVSRVDDRCAERASPAAAAARSRSGAPRRVRAAGGRARARASLRFSAWTAKRAAVAGTALRARRAARPARASSAGGVARPSTSRKCSPADSPARCSDRLRDLPSAAASASRYCGASSPVSSTPDLRRALARAPPATGRCRSMAVCRPRAESRAPARRCAAAGCAPRAELARPAPAPPSWLCSSSAASRPPARAIGRAAACATSRPWSGARGYA